MRRINHLRVDQPDLFEQFHAPAPEPRPDYRCPGCGAKPGDWDLSPRFRKLLGGLRLCVECAADPEVVEMHVRDDRPPDPEACLHPKGSEQKIRVMAARVKAGLNPFQIWDDVLSPAPYKVATGAPDHRAADGETGVERCGKGWRVRPFFRGRKWPLGVFLDECSARERVKRFWHMHPHDDRQPPILWLPTSDEDRAVAIEEEHLDEWFLEWGLRRRPVQEIARAYRKELREGKVRLPTDQVFNELERRLEAAAGPMLYVDTPGSESADPAECLQGA